MAAARRLLRLLGFPLVQAGEPFTAINQRNFKTKQFILTDRRRPGIGTKLFLSLRIALP